MKNSEIKKVLTAIAEGYPMAIRHDRFIWVENPDYREDDGSVPRLVIDVTQLPGDNKNE